MNDTLTERPKYLLFAQRFGKGAIQPGILSCLLLCLLIFVPCIAIAESLKTGLKAHVELSYVNAYGNTNTETLANKLEVKKEGLINRYFLIGKALYARSDNKETSNRLRIEGRGERVLKDGLFASATAGYRRDKFSGYRYRVFGGPGLGYDLIKTDKHLLGGIISIFYSHDEFSAGTVRGNEYMTGKVGTKYEWKIKKDLKFKEDLEYVVSSEDTDNYFIDSETGLEIKVNSIVSFGFTYLINYQNLLPTEEVEHTDTTFMATLIIDYH